MTMIQRKLLAVFAALTTANSKVLVSNLLPRNSLPSNDGSVTLSAGIIESNPFNFIRLVRFELRANGDQLYDETVTEPSMPGIYTLQVNDLFPGVNYCFRVQARNRFFLGGWSDESCFQIFDDDRVQDFPSQENTNNVRYGLQDDCLVYTPGQFRICLDLSSSSGVIEDWFSAFTGARDLWESAITFNGVELNPRDFDTSFTATGAYPEWIDGLYIASRVENIDGPGGVLGTAGPISLLKVNGQSIPINGRMRFDVEDLQRLQNIGSLDNVITHEMGHVLGIGTLWGLSNIYTAKSPDDNLYRGPAVNREWDAEGCRSVDGFAPIVETGGGSGTAFGHFDEGCFGEELMTGFVGSSTTFSRFTIAALEDLGYGVDYSVADAYTVPPQCCFFGSRLRRLNDPLKRMASEAQVEDHEAGTQPRQATPSPRLIERAIEYGREELGRLTSLRNDLEDRLGGGGLELQAVDFVNVLVEEGGVIFDVTVTDDR